MDQKKRKAEILAEVSKRTGEDIEVVEKVVSGTFELLSILAGVFRFPVFAAGLAMIQPRYRRIHMDKEQWTKDYNDGKIDADDFYELQKLNREYEELLHYIKNKGYGA